MRRMGRSSSAIIRSAQNENTLVGQRSAYGRKDNKKITTNAHIYPKLLPTSRLHCPHFTIGRCTHSWCTLATYTTGIKKEYEPRPVDAAFRAIASSHPLTFTQNMKKQEEVKEPDTRPSATTAQESVTEAPLPDHAPSYLARHGFLQHPSAPSVVDHCCQVIVEMRAGHIWSTRSVQYLEVTKSKWWSAISTNQRNEHRTQQHYRQRSPQRSIVKHATLLTRSS